MVKMKKLFKNKIFIAGISVALVAVLAITSVVLTLNRPSVPVQQREDALGTTSNITVQVPLPSGTNSSDANGNTKESGTSISANVGTDKKPDSGVNSKFPSGKGQTNTQSGTKTPPKTDGSVTIGTGSGSDSNPDKTTSNPTGGVIGVDPVPRGDEPSGASGVKPKQSDWVSVNSNVPQELYNYDYTVMDGEDIITGAQMKWRGYTDWDRAANAAIGGLKQYYTIDYRNIKSTNPNDRDKYLTDLVYWTSETAYMDICDYMKNAINNKIISTANVVTDGSLMYNNGVQLIRARVYVTWQSGAGYYGLQNGVKYYKDVEVAVYAATGEDRYGFGKCNDFNILLFSNNCFNSLCAWKKA
jgi:hypothetical protein